MVLIFVVLKYSFLPYCVVGILSYIFKHALQINDKGQLRLSHRALLPDTDSENSDVKQPTSKLTEDMETSPKSSDKDLPKKVSSLPRDGLPEQKIEQPKDRSKTSKVTASSKRSSEDDSVLPSKKFVRRLVNSSQDKDKSKKSSNKEVSSVSSKDENSLVSGEA